VGGWDGDVDNLVLRARLSNRPLRAGAGLGEGSPGNAACEPLKFRPPYLPIQTRSSHFLRCVLGEFQFEEVGSGHPLPNCLLQDHPSPFSAIPSEQEPY